MVERYSGMGRKYLTLRISITVILLFSGASMARAEEPSKPRKFGFGVGYALAKFDTNVKFTNKESDRSVFVDAEGTLGLPETDGVPIIYGLYRISKGHAIGFSYFEVRRESSIFNFNETIDDVTIDGQVTFSDDTRFFNLAWLPTFYEDDRSRVLGRFGINSMNINYALDAEGTITYEDDSVGGSLHEEVGVIAPLPLIGVNLMYAFTPRWNVSTQVSFIGGRYQDVSALVLNTEVLTGYRLSKVFSLLFGIAYFDADVVIEDDLDRTDVNYGYSGAYLGLNAVF